MIIKKLFNHHILQGRSDAKLLREMDVVSSTKAAEVEDDIVKMNDSPTLEEVEIYKEEVKSLKSEIESLKHENVLLKK